MKLFAVVVLVLALACFPVRQARFSSPRLALYSTPNYPSGTPAPSTALNSGSAGFDVQAKAYPNNRGFLDSTVSVSTAVQAPGVPTVAKAPFHLKVGQLQALYSYVHQWLRISSAGFVGGVIAVFQYLLFLIGGLAFLRNQIVHGRLPQSKLVVVPVSAEPAGSVIECRVPDTRAPVPPAKPTCRPMLRRPLFNSSISRLGGPMNNTAPQLVAPVQPPRRGRWIELVSVEGKLVLCSHHTGPGRSLEWTVQYFPRHEHSYYLSQYSASPRVNPLLEQLVSSRPLVVKGPIAIMEEVSDYIFSTSGAEPEVDATSVPLPLSRSESPDTSIDMRDPSNTHRDSDSDAVVPSNADADTNWVEAGSFSLPHPEHATRRRHSCPSLQTYSADGRSQQHYSFRRASVAIAQMPRLYFFRPDSPDDLTSIGMTDSSNNQRDSDSDAVVPSTADADANSVEAGSIPLPHPEQAIRRRHSFPNLRTHAPCQKVHTSRRVSLAGEQMPRLYLSRSESPDPQVDMRDSSETQRDSDSDAVVPSTADADANSVEAGYFSPPHMEPATRRRHSCPDLRTHFSHAPSQKVHYSRRVSIAVEQMPRLYLTGPVRNEPQQSYEEEAAIDCILRPQVANLVGREEDGSARGDNMTQEVKFKFRRGGKRNTARKHKRQMQDQDPGNSGAGPSSAH